MNIYIYYSDYVWYRCVICNIFSIVWLRSKSNLHFNCRNCPVDLGGYFCVIKTIKTIIFWPDTYLLVWEVAVMVGEGYYKSLIDLPGYTAKSSIPPNCLYRQYWWCTELGGITGYDCIWVKLDCFPSLSRSLNIRWKHWVLLCF